MRRWRDALRIGSAEVRVLGRSISRPRPQPASSMPRSACQARMSDHSSDDGESSGSGGSLTTTAAQDTASPTDHEGARGRLPGLPGTEKDDCTPTYSGQSLSRIATENSPSCGWRGVCWKMGVMPDGHD